MILMIDWGNSLLKFIEIELLTELNILNASLQKVTNLEELTQRLLNSYDNILVSSVRAPNENEQLKKILANKASDTYFARTSRLACGVSCAYDEPANLGIDRWLGILAAAKSNDSVGIISIGTAITIDIVINKNHIGGQILPGRQLMFKSLLHTGQVRAKPNKTTQSLIKLGRSTNECVNFAIETAIKGYLETVIYAMEEQYQLKNWVVTGGGSKIIENLTATDKIFKARPFLVFEGMRNSYNELSQIK